MKAFGLKILLLLLLASLAGCARGGSWFSDEKEMDSARHWNILANDVANRINNELIRKKQYTAAIHVRHSCGTPNNCGPGGTYPFDEGFHDLLTSQLVSFGIHTQITPEHADLLVDYKVQVVYHAGQWQAWDWPKPGVATALAAGIMVLRDAPWGMVAAAGAVDMFRANYQDNGEYEVIITTSITQGQRYVMRFSDIYTIPNMDFWQYRKTSPAPEIKLTGPTRPSPPPPTKKSTAL